MVRCEYGGCQRISDYRMTVKKRIDIRPSFCCNYHIGNVIESKHLSNVQYIVDKIKKN